MGKPKGLWQELYELGHLHLPRMSDRTFPSPKSHYTQTDCTVKGKASDFDKKGNLKEGRHQYCLRHIRNSLSDFKDGV